MAALNPELNPELARLPLVDHHCHSIVGAELDRAALEALLTEGDPPPAGHTAFDSLLGTSVLRWCAPVLDLPPFAAPDEYVARRGSLGPLALERLLRASGTSTLLVDGGYRPGELMPDAELGALAGAETLPVVRIETVVEGALTSADTAPATIRSAVAGAAAGAVGLKSVAAYRVGLALPPRPPSDAEVVAAASGWLAAGTGRLDDPTLVAAAVWAAVDTGLPLQFHTGFGDPDELLRQSDPALLQEFARACRTPVVLLHCWPYHRQAAYLAHALPNVWMDLGLTLPYVGARAPAVLAEALELVPFGKLLYSSDAFGAAELYLLAALRFRQALGSVLDGLVSAGELAASDAGRIAAMVGAGNARSLYEL